MNVRLATQVLSESVGNMGNLLNIKNDIEHTTSIKEFLTPFTSPTDKRIKWLINDFLSYFERWQESIEGNFTTADKKKMFLSHQTYTGILINH